eukprot:Pgem_evm1s9016
MSLHYSGLNYYNDVPVVNLPSFVNHAFSCTYYDLKKVGPIINPSEQNKFMIKQRSGSMVDDIDFSRESDTFEFGPIMYYSNDKSYNWPFKIHLNPTQKAAPCFELGIAQ